MSNNNNSKQNMDDDFFSNDDIESNFSHNDLFGFSGDEDEEVKDINELHENLYPDEENNVTKEEIHDIEGNEDNNTSNNKFGFATAISNRLFKTKKIMIIAPVVALLLVACAVGIAGSQEGWFHHTSHAASKGGNPPNKPTGALTSVQAEDFAKSFMSSSTTNTSFSYGNPSIKYTVSSLNVDGESKDASNKDVAHPDYFVTFTGTITPTITNVKSVSETLDVFSKDDIIVETGHSWIDSLPPINGLSKADLGFLAPSADDNNPGLLATLNLKKGSKGIEDITSIAGDSNGATFYASYPTDNNDPASPTAIINSKPFTIKIDTGDKKSVAIGDLADSSLIGFPCNEKGILISQDCVADSSAVKMVDDISTFKYLYLEDSATAPGSLVIYISNKPTIEEANADSKYTLQIFVTNSIPKTTPKPLSNTGNFEVEYNK